ncbi:MAG: recombinase family protein [Lachnospiraceae bacterium]|nr:recombinase family protein [Lachnospiraceae bacterium]
MSRYLTGAIYIRVSTTKQDELSPDTQKRLLLEYAQKNNILINDSFIFIEDGISGKNADKRPEFQKMIAYSKSKEHPFDVILVWKFSRFARNQEESIVYKSLLKKNNIDVVSISEPLMEGPFGSLIERIIEWMDEYYSIRLSGEVTRGMTEKAMRGGFQSKPPYGYRMIPGNPIPDIVPEESKVVKEIFDMYLNQGKSAFDIAKFLSVSGITTRKGNPFRKATVTYMLTNPFYCGIVRWNVRTGNSRRTFRSENEWINVKGSHEPIISKELFDKVQDKLSLQKQTCPPKSRPASSYSHYLSGLIHCSNCGGVLVSSKGRNTNGKSYGNFNCTNYSKGGCLVSHAISHKKAEAAIKLSLEDFVNAKEVTFAKTAFGKFADTSFLQTSLSKLESKERRMKDAYANGIDTLDEYRENKELLLMERKKIQKELDLLRLSNEISARDIVLMKQYVESLIELLDSDDISIAEKNAALKSIMKDILFDKANNRFIVHYYLS